MTTMLFFARAREAAGTGSLSVSATSVGEALKLASSRFGPGFESVLSMCSILVDGVVVAADRAWDTHVSESTEIAVLPPVSGGEDVKMIDVGDKPETAREATAVCTLVCSPGVRDALLGGTVPKGDAAGTARVAGILAAKKVPELIPLCHPLRLTGVDITTESVPNGIEVRATVRGRDRTGFEMEALTACAVAALTLYDMGKSEEASMRIEGLRLLAKSGGKSGSVTFE